MKSKRSLEDDIQETLKTIDEIHSVHDVGTLKVLETYMVGGVKDEVIKKRKIRILALKAIARGFRRAGTALGRVDNG